MYDEIFDGWQKSTIFCVVIFVLFVGVFCAGYVCGIDDSAAGSGKGCGGVHDNGAGIDDIRAEFKRIEGDQYQLADEIRQAGSAAERVASGNREAAESAKEICSGLRDAGGLIDECQQIIGRVRNRGKKGTVAN